MTEYSKPIALTALRQRVLECIVRDPATRLQVAERLGMHCRSVKRALDALLDARLIERERIAGSYVYSRTDLPLIDTGYRREQTLQGANHGQDVLAGRARMAEVARHIDAMCRV
jgi:DNA-binding GntR family transcriptional regulator